MDALGKVMCSIGMVMIIVGVGIAMVSIVEDEDNSSKIIFDDSTQNYPTWIYQYKGDFTYEVFIESGTDIDVRLSGENRENFFDECVVPCHYDGEGIQGYAYEGEIWLSESDVWMLEFDGDGDIIIRETSPYQSFDTLVWYICAIIGIVVLIKGFQRRDIGPYIDDRPNDAEHSISIGHQHLEHQPESEHLATIQDDESGVLEEIGDRVSDVMRKPFTRSDKEEDDKLAMFDDHYMK